MISSSYKMFVQWGWVRTDSLNADVAQQLANLRKCARVVSEAHPSTPFSPPPPPPPLERCRPVAKRLVASAAASRLPIALILRALRYLSLSQ